MPEPTGRGQRYMPGLDGLRALAVLAVIAYHLNLGWAPGGLLGVGVFFTLSGYLITDLLLSQREAGQLRLASFWQARARRLLPALFSVLIVVSIWVAISDRSQLSEVRDQVLAAVVYLSNWWQSFQHVSYFARFAAPSPLNHLWSLSVEEQFYLLWPWLLLFGVNHVRERWRPDPIRPRLAALTLVLAIGSAVEMVLLFAPSFDPSRVYYGTDTRAFGLLFGASLALVWPSRALRTQVGARAPEILDTLGVLGLAGIIVLVWRTNQYSASLYRGGLVLLSVCTLLVIAAVTHPAARLGRLLGWGPLRWLGVRSYAIYLWHAPIIVLTTPATLHTVQPLRAVLQVAGTIAVAALSWRYLEDPIRHGALRRWSAQARSVRWRPTRLAPEIVLGGAATVVAVAFAVVALSGALSTRAVNPLLAGAQIPPPPGGSRTRHDPSTRTGSAHRPARTSSHAGATPSSTTPTTSHPGRPASRSSTTSTATRARAAAPHTSCRSVVHIGDSTSEGLISTSYLPDPKQRMPAQYARVGVRTSKMEIAGATSIVETLPGGINARRVAQGLVAGGYRGCWVIALGTNDSADIYVGSTISLATRIHEMMAVIGNQPALWVNAKTLLSGGPYSESDMQRWNHALVQACARYPDMRVYNWAGAVKDKWFIPDGIHYYSPGYAARAHLIADALAEAFPASGSGGAGSGSSCLVSTPSISVPVLGLGHPSRG